jgi:hypothetical protein
MVAALTLQVLDPSQSGKLVMFQVRFSVIIVCFFVSLCLFVWFVCSSRLQVLDPSQSGKLVMFQVRCFVIIVCFVKVCRFFRVFVWLLCVLTLQVLDPSYTRLTNTHKLTHT